MAAGAPGRILVDMRTTTSRTVPSRTTPTTSAAAPAAVSSFLARHCRWELMSQPKRPLPRR